MADRSKNKGRPGQCGEETDEREGHAAERVDFLFGLLRRICGYLTTDAERFWSWVLLKTRFGALVSQRHRELQLDRRFPRYPPFVPAPPVARRHAHAARRRFPLRSCRHR